MTLGVNGELSQTERPEAVGTQPLQAYGPSVRSGGFLKRSMKFVTHLIQATLVTACLVISPGALSYRVDPTDDLSFSLHSTEPQRFRTMGEAQIAALLADRLDLFPRSKTPELARHLVALCDEYRFDPAFVLALIQVESRFRVKVVSPAGAVGLMQVMPATAAVVARELGLRTFRLKKVDRSRFERMLTDPFLNLEVGIAYLAWLRDRYRDLSPYYLVAAYNIGPARLEELLSRKEFRPVNTRRYYEAIRKGIPGMRFYQRPVGGPAI